MKHLVVPGIPLAPPPSGGMRVKDGLRPLLAFGERAKVDYMGVLAVAIYDDVRFRVTDFTTEGGKPHFVLDMHILSSPKDRAGRHFGEPVDVSSKLIEDARAFARAQGLCEKQAQVEIIVWVLAQGRIRQKLDKKCAGGCPEKLKEMFSRARAESEKKAMDAVARDPAATTLAAPRPMRL